MFRDKLDERPIKINRAVLLVTTLSHAYIKHICNPRCFTQAPLHVLYVARRCLCLRAEIEARRGSWRRLTPAEYTPLFVYAGCQMNPMANRFSDANATVMATDTISRTVGIVFEKRQPHRRKPAYSARPGIFGYEVKCQ